MVDHLYISEKFKAYTQKKIYQVSRDSDMETVALT